MIYSFKGIAQKDGAHPGGTLLPVANELYGETEFGGSGGGACSEFEGCGTVYKVDASGNERVVSSLLRRQRTVLTLSAVWSR